MDTASQEVFSEEQRQEVIRSQEGILMEIRKLHVKHQADLTDRFNKGLVLGMFVGAAALALGMMLG
ncbi:TPA: hypothetical protein QDZ75_000848 [Stenotrophomonas maltophilia]|uniref:hypothetical protein n=1 Tax=Stenotrophomonas TaxID=40323 RepID=UPI00066A844C|nr:MULTISPECIES: hypothetical protein [Stenotrophomonas]MBA0220702.1 hypothetical protein [Stenotrophomonas maltophilia]MBH1370824.1 hypothetical protein [Stenotrophomonas maltophilia]MBH1506761.1 hypothetical protein [Stenotrophomonas maltophilia]PJL44223.1 hypothetical protein B9Y56_05860 [Stenotrophomonas maltophilia]PZS86607.1 hypothetical protein A7X63_05305 [Stenotrophomonas maltophilia]